MALLPPDFTIGRLSSVKRLSLVLKMGRYGHDFIVSEGKGGMVATLLGQDHKHAFVSFPTIEAHNHDGLIIDGISIELDVNVDPNREFGERRLGSLVRKDESLFLLGQPDDAFRGTDNLVPLIHGLPKCDENFSAAFHRWSIVKGEGSRKTVLYDVDVSSSDQG